MRSLRSSLVLAVLVPLSAAVTLAGTLVFRQLESAAVERMEEDVQLVARAIRLPLSRALERDRVEGAVDALESAFRIGRVYGAHLYDREGRLVSSLGTAGTGENPDRLSSMAEDDERLGEYGRAGDEEVYSYFVSLTSGGGRPIGLLQVTRRRSDIRDQVSALRLRAGGTLAAGLAVMGLLVLVGHRKAVGRHLDRLLESMSRVEEGDRAHRTDTGGPKEIGSLAAAFNRMLDSMSRAEESVRRHRDEQLRLERELRRTEKVAAVGELAAGVAHELGTPLSALDGRAQRLIRRDLPDDMASEVREIRHAASRMESIVRQLLEFGRGVHRPRRPVRSDRLLRSVVASHGDEAEQAGVALDVSGPLPATVVSVDRGAMERALGNLIRNGIQAARARVEVGLFRNRAHDQVGFRVADDGDGVDQVLEDRIFEPFFTTKPTGQGTGLGLAVVHGITEDHGGRVEVCQGPLGGAEFRLILPAHEGQDAGAPAVPARAQGPAEAPTSEGRDPHRGDPHRV